MAKQVLIEHEAYEFGDPPEFLSQWERLLGGKQYVKFYLQLRDPIKDGKVFTLRVLGEPIGMSQNRAIEGLSILEEYGFVTFDTDNEPARLIVRDVPYLPDGEISVQAELKAQATLKEMDDSEVETFLSYWNGLHYHYKFRSYDVVKGRDTSVVKRLITNVGLPHVKEVAKWYWAHRNEEDPTDVGSFSRDFTLLASECVEFQSRRL